MKQLNRIIHLLEMKQRSFSGETRDLLTDSINEEVEILKNDFGINNKTIIKTAYSRGLEKALFNI